MVADARKGKRQRGGQPLEETVTPALFDHCANTYRKMREEAKPVRLPDGGDDDYIIVYQGNLTALILQDLKLSAPYYTSVTRALKAMGCVKQLRRGGGTTPSQWELIREPTEADFNAHRAGEPKPESRAKKKSQGDMLQDQINNLNGRVNYLEEVVNKMIRGVL